MESCFFYPAPASVSVSRSGFPGSCPGCYCLVTNCGCILFRCLGFCLVWLLCSGRCCCMYLYLYLSAVCILVCASACVQHYILSCIPLLLSVQYYLVLWSVQACSIWPVPVLVAVHPGPVSWSLCAVLCGLIPVSDPVPGPLTSGPCRLICNPMYSIYKPNTIGIR